MLSEVISGTANGNCPGGDEWVCREISTVLSKRTTCLSRSNSLTFWCLLTTRICTKLIIFYIYFIILYKLHVYIFHSGMGVVRVGCSMWYYKQGTRVSGLTSTMHPSVNVSLCLVLKTTTRVDVLLHYFTHTTQVTVISNNFYVHGKVHGITL